MEKSTKIIIAVSVLAVAGVGTYIAVQSAKKSAPPVISETATTTSRERGGLLGFTKNWSFSVVGK